MSANHNHDSHPEPWDGDYLPDLLIEPGKRNGLIEIGQSTGNGEHSAIEIHPSQVLYIAQKLGMVRELSQDEATAREALQVRINELERERRRLRLTLLACQDRTEQLFHDLCLQHDRGHEDLSLEVAKAAALGDILDLACADFEGEFGVVGPSDSKRVYPPTTAQQDAQARKTPVFPPKDPQISHETPPKLGALSRTKPPAPGLFEGDTHEG